MRSRRSRPRRGDPPEPSPIGQCGRVVAMPYSSIIDVLRERIPEFGPSIDESIGIDEGEVLPHVIFGDLTRFVLGARDRGDDQVVRRCLDFLDEALRDGDPLVQNLVQVSFVENVGPFVGDVATFVRTWPTALGREAERQRDWKPGDPGPMSLWGSA
jgi:hypothetical protein